MTVKWQNHLRNKEHWSLHLNDYQQMDKDAQDKYLMSLIKEFKATNNKKGYSVFWIRNKREIEKHYQVGRERLDRLADSVWKSIKHDNKVITWVTELPLHGNCNKRSHNSFTEEFDKLLIQFIESLDSEPLPFNYLKGKKDIQVLPIGTCKNSLYAEFMQYLKNNNCKEDCGYSTFTVKMSKLCPTVTILKEQEDVCDFCYNYRIALSSVNNEQEKQIQTAKWQMHIIDAINRRVTYFFDRNICLLGQETSENEKELIMKKINEKYSKYPLITSKFMIPHVANRLKVITFDYKQNITIPSDPIQPSAYYYNTKRICNVFGVVQEFSNIDIFRYFCMMSVKEEKLQMKLLLWSLKYSKTSSLIKMII